MASEITKALLKPLKGVSEFDLHLSAGRLGAIYIKMMGEVDFEGDIEVDAEIPPVKLSFDEHRRL